MPQFIIYRFKLAGTFWPVSLAAAFWERVVSDYNVGLGGVLEAPTVQWILLSRLITFKYNMYSQTSLMPPPYPHHNI
jgi:hypothetical protein